MKRFRKKSIPLTLSPQGRGDNVKAPLTLTLSPQGRGDKAGSLTFKERGNKGGFSILEMIVSMLLLGAAMAIIVPALGWMGMESRSATMRQEAIQGLNNLMDQLTTRPYAELTPEAATKLKLPESLERQLPGAKLHIEINETKANSKRIHAELSWNHRNGSRLAPVRLTAWVHTREGQP